MPPEREKKPEWLASLWRESLRAMSLGWDLAIPIFGGALLGNFMDKFLGTSYIFTIGLILLGIIISYYNLGKFIARMRKLDQKYLHEKRNDEVESVEKE